MTRFKRIHRLVYKYETWKVWFFNARGNTRAGAFGLPDLSKSPLDFNVHEQKNLLLIYRLINPLHEGAIVIR
jgi:hypothetical protein